jgi:tetratricopeptide (TPR) repeat protein
MTTRRLNKKVALIGSGVFLIVMIAAIAVVLRLGQDPQEAMKEAEAALQAARAETNEQAKQESYKSAERAFHKAYSAADSDTLRIELLFKMSDMYLETKEWNYVLGCWEQIIKLDPENVKARYNRLKYIYIIADNGARGAWQTVQEQASQLLDVAERNGLLAEDTAKYEVPEMRQDSDDPQRLGPYLYLLRGRAALEMTRLGMVTDKDASLAKSVADLKKVQELDPNSIPAYSYLARAVVTKGEIFAAKGNFQERDKANQEALGILEQAVKLTDSDPKASMQLLSLKLKLAQDSGFEQLKQKIKLLEPEYAALVEKFSSNPKAFAALSSFYAEASTYAGSDVRSEYLDKAIKAAEKAMELDPKNVVYVINAASLHYRRSSVYDEKPEMDKAIEIAKSGLSLPGVQDTTGPWQRANRNNRYGLYALLAHCYIERVLNAKGPATSPQVSDDLAEAEKDVHEIDQIFGSAEEPLAYKWKGMLELAKGDKEGAVRDLYQAYEQFRAVMPPQPPWPRDAEFAYLSYTLAGLFKDTSETGAELEFLIGAIYSGISETKPDAYLDYVDVLLELNHWSEALQHVDVYEQYFGASDRSRSLRVQALIGARQLEDAESELAKMPQDGAETLKLRLMLTQKRVATLQLAAEQEDQRSGADAEVQPVAAGGEPLVDSQTATSQKDRTTELYNYLGTEAELIEKLLAVDPNSVDEVSLIGVCRGYLAQGQTDKVRHLLDQYTKAFPDSTTAQVYYLILSEPVPSRVSHERLKQIEKEALEKTRDPILRAVQLGVYYRRYNEPEKALSEFKMAFDRAMSQDRIPEGPLRERTILAANHYLDLAIGKKDWQLAEEIVAGARGKNLDGCQGQVFGTRLALAKGDFKDALTRINECLKLKPVFSYGYMLRSSVDASLGNDHAAIDDIQKAASLNPLDGTIARGLASALYHRNQELGAKVSDAQVAETKDALLKAIALNPGDLGLRSLYADYIAPTEPLKAVAIRQDLLEANPSLENTLLLGKLATEVAVRQSDPQTKQALFKIAGSAFEQAKQAAPNDKRMLYYYAEYLRAKGQGEQAKALLEGSSDKTLLWDHYLQVGQYDEAGKVLKGLYESGKKDSNVLRGLLLVAERTGDRTGVKQYSEELIKSQDTLENNFAQIQAFLRVGLIKDADLKLQSFKEKYPNDPRSLQLQTWLVMRQGRLNEALDLANRNLQNNPDDPTAWRLRGEINFFREDFMRAVSDLQKSKTLSDEPATRVLLAKTYVRMERYEDAITELRNAIGVPGAPVEGRLLLERIYVQLGRRSELKKFYQDMLGEFPDSAYWLNRAGALAVQMGDYDDAESLFAKAVETRQKLHAGEDKADVAHDGLYATAVGGYLQSLIASAGTPNTASWNPAKLDKVFTDGAEYTKGPFAYVAYLQMARAKLMLSDRATAVDYALKAIDAVGADGILTSDILTRACKLLGAKEMEDLYQRKLQADPDSLADNLAMFRLATINDENTKAIDHIDKCISLTGPTDPRRVDYVLSKGEVLTRLYEQTSDKNYLKTAITEYESLLTKMPNNTHVATVLNNLAYLLAEEGERLSKALDYAKRALDGRPDSPGMLDTYAYVLLKNGDATEAAKSLAAALQCFEQDGTPVPAEVYEHEGMIKEKLGAKQEALAAYKEALKTGEHELSGKAKQRIEQAVARVSE